MNKDVQRLREPGAWVLLGSVALQILAGLIGLVFGRGGLPFTYQALQYVLSDAFFAGVTMTGLVVLAVLLATRLGGPPTPQARNVALAALVALGVAALLDVICVLAGLGAGGSSSGVLLDSSTATKFAMFLYGLAKLAVLGVGGYYVLTVFQSFGPAARPGPGYPQPGWNLPGAQSPYPQPAYGAPRQQPLYGRPPQQYPRQGHVPAPYAQPGYGWPVQPAAHPQQPPMPPHPPSGPQGPSTVPPAAPRSAAPAKARDEEEGEGEWTRAYGPAELPAIEDDTPEPKPEGPGSSSANDSHRPSE